MLFRLNRKARHNYSLVSSKTVSRAGAGGASDSIMLAPDEIELSVYSSPEITVPAFMVVMLNRYVLYNKGVFFYSHLIRLEI